MDSDGVSSQQEQPPGPSSLQQPVTEAHPAGASGASVGRGAGTYGTTTKATCHSRRNSNKLLLSWGQRASTTYLRVLAKLG
jgi:hypothetical protein